MSTKFTTIFLIIAFSCFVSCQIPLSEQNDLSLLNNYFGYYPTNDPTTQCPPPPPTSPTPINNIYCGSSSPYAVTTIKYVENIPFNPLNIPNYSYLPLDFPSLTGIWLQRNESYDTSLNPLGFFGNIPAVNAITMNYIYRNNGQYIPSSFPSVPLTVLNTFSVKIYYDTLNPITPYNYSFSSTNYPALRNVVLQEFPNGTLTFETPVLGSITFYGKSGNIILTSTAADVKVRRMDLLLATHEFILNGFTIFPVANFAFQRPNTLPGLISFDGKTTLNFADYPNFYLPATNSTIPESLFCNKNLNLKYLPTGYASFVNPSRMCGATIDATTYLVQNSKITITGDNLFFIESLQNKQTFAFNQIDHTNGLVEIVKFEKYEYTITSTASSGSETIIFSKFNGVSFNVQWSTTLFINSVGYTNKINGVQWTIAGLFDDITNLSVNVGAYSCAVTSINTNSITCLVSSLMSTGSYTVTVSNGSNISLTSTNNAYDENSPIGL